MANLPIEELETKVGSRYALTVLAGKRARELRDGAPRLVSADSNNPILIALQEIHEGKIFPENLDYDAGLDVVANTPDMVVVGLDADHLADLTDADAAGVELAGSADITGHAVGDSAVPAAADDETGEDVEDASGDAADDNAEE